MLDRSDSAPKDGLTATLQGMHWWGTILSVVLPLN